MKRRHTCLYGHKWGITLIWNRYLVSVTLTTIEDAMRPKKKTLETEAEVKPDASIVDFYEYL